MKIQCLVARFQVAGNQGRRRIKNKLLGITPRLPKHHTEGFLDITYQRRLHLTNLNQNFLVLVILGLLVWLINKRPNKVMNNKRLTCTPRK